MNKIDILQNLPMWRHYQDANTSRVYIHLLLIADQPKINITLMQLTLPLLMSIEDVEDSLKVLTATGEITMEYAGDSIDIKLNMMSRPEVPPEVARLGNFDFRRAMVKEGVPEEVADAYMVVRRKAKAANTKLAFDALKREADAAGYKLATIVRICAERSWRGFSAEWASRLPIKPDKEPELKLTLETEGNGYQ